MAKRRIKYVRDSSGRFARAAEAKLHKAARRRKPERTLGKKVTEGSSSTNGMFTTGASVTQQKRRALNGALAPIRKQAQRIKR